MRFFRADAAYAIPAIYARLEEAGYYYAIRLPANSVLKEKIAHRMTRPSHLPPRSPILRIPRPRMEAQKCVNRIAEKRGLFAFWGREMFCGFIAS